MSTQQVIRLTHAQQRRVWEGWFASEVRAHYFADLSGRYRRLQTLVTWLMLLFSSGAFVSLLAHAPGWIAPVFVLVTSALSFASLVLRYEKKATDATDLYFRWNALAIAYRDLWENMYSEGAVKRLSALDAKANNLGRQGTFFPVDEKRINKWYNVVRENLAVAAHA